MIPHDLNPREIEIQDPDNIRLVIVTSNKARHLRFALKLQEMFRGRASLWVELQPQPNPLGLRTSRLQKLLRLGKAFLKRPQEIVGWLDHHRLQRSYGSEAAFFAGELKRLRQHQVLEPKLLTVEQLYDPDFLREVSNLQPAVLCTLGGPLYRSSLLQQFQLALNQHAGHSPELKGGHTTEWALYHRKLNWVAATVHITSSGADSGSILRRSQTCVVPGDNPAILFWRTVAAGTDLMIECLHEVFRSGRATVFDQPLAGGTTVLSREYSPRIQAAVFRDFRNGWIDEELARLKKF